MVLFMFMKLRRTGKRKQSELTFGGSQSTTRSTSGISRPLAATSVATRQRTFPSRKLCHEQFLNINNNYNH